ncbi:MAG TPA: hypothetical protein VFD03_07790 [Clostridia bacterium]|nr:hypothetical protein [Clostridia bacterium]
MAALKVTSRELTLLIALLSVAIIYLLYTFLFSPLLMNISTARDALNTAKTQQIQIEENYTNLPNVIKQQEALALETETKVAEFIPNISENVLVTFFVDTIAKGGPVIDNVSFEQLSAVNLDTLVAQPYTELSYPYGELAAKAKNIEYVGTPPAPAPAPATQTGNTVLAQGVNIDFGTATYEQVLNQMKAVETIKRTIVIDSLSLSKGEAGALAGYIHYNFYGIDKLTDKDKGLNQTVLTEPNGKTNPFN